MSESLSLSLSVSPARPLHYEETVGFRMWRQPAESVEHTALGGGGIDGVVAGAAFWGPASFGPPTSCEHKSHKSGDDGVPRRMQQTTHERQPRAQLRQLVGVSNVGCSVHRGALHVDLLHGSNLQSALS